MKNHLHLLTFILCANLASTALAHERGHGHSSGSASVRTWTLTASGAHFHGSFVTANDTQATFEREDGRVISIDRAELIPQDQDWIVDRLAEIKRVNELRNVQLVAQRNPAKPGDSRTKEGKPAPEIHQHFLPFKQSLGLRWDDRFYYVESNGMPDHPMMTGITAWQQQVPLPQNYSGNNAWQIPLFPVRAASPMSAKTNFFRGAIALAVNGVPIFNPIKNDGKTDTFIAGELDQWGGHCGRADDYHYHLPPVHLEKTVGEHKPIAYALDGYPIYGYQEQTDPDYAPLDWLNGHTDNDGNYHYHSTKTYSYLNGGFYGVVTERDGQVDPQPRAKPVRPSLPPLRGAKITGFDRSDDEKKFRIELDVSGKEQSVEYALTGDSVQFTFNEGRSKPRTETYRLSNQGGQPAPGGQQRRGGKAGKQPPARGEKDRQQSEATQPRRPWIEVHASEMDTNQDGMLTRDEVQAEARKAFSAYDDNRDGTLLLSDLSKTRPVRSAMGGFIREHAKELDRDDDGKLTEQEILSNAERMFDKADTDRDGRITITDEQKPTGQTKVKPKESPEPNRPVSSSKARSAIATSHTHPNIIFILIDDMGWRDVGFAGNDFVETPNIDRLAVEGVRFTQAYASAPNCAPTRACLMSGQYTPRHGVYTVIDPRHEPGQPHHRILSAPSEESLSGVCITIAELLQQHGYATACFGMWNLGRGRNGPTTALGQGFDLYEKPQDLGFEQNGYFDRNGRYLTDVLFDEGMRFIEQHAGKPFFLYLPTHAVHAPFDPKSHLVKKYQQKAARQRIHDADPIYGAMIEAVDDNVGRLMSHLEQLKLSENTLIVFTSDNGGTPQYVAPLNGSKGALYEGGIRVPCAVWWRGIESPGRSFDEPILSMDFYPTLAALAGVKLPKEQQIDGVNLLPAITQGVALDRESVFWHFPCYIGRGEPCSAIRSGDWKLIQKFEDQSLELYNLSDDPGETRNLAARLPERTQELKDTLSQWQTSLAAPTPTKPNPNFDPTSVRQGKKQRGRGANSSRKKKSKTD